MRRLSFFALMAVAALGGLAFLTSYNNPGAEAGVPEAAGSKQTDPAVVPETASTASTAGDLVVHEWGTFTSFSGSNGVQLDFRPLDVSDLPAFVLDRSDQAGGRSLFQKATLRTRIRMETPVTYFYTERPRTVRVRVDFPKGLLTEFYPPVRQMLPAIVAELANDPQTGRGPSSLDWGEVTLLPESVLRPQIEDAALSTAIAARLMQNAGPHAGQFDHYAYARETDSALVAVNLPAVESSVLTSPPPSGLHLEKFLFYRGVGKFELPISAETDMSGSTRVTNSGQDPLRSMFLVNVRRDQGQTVIARQFIDEIAGKRIVTLGEAMQDTSLEALAQEVQQALIAEGLFEKEAMAMTKTWTDSWFQEAGTRLFYIVPRALTDTVLPLQVTPAPSQTVRVLVGRLELLPASQEQKLLQAVAASALEYKEAYKRDGVAPMLPVPPAILALGRFTEPALVRVRELATDATVSGEAQRLLEQLRH